MKIGELAARTGLTVETIRYYEKENLIPKASRTLSNYREYGNAHLAALQTIRHCRSLSMSLADIRVVLRLAHEANPEQADEAHEMVRQHIAAIDERIRSLMALRQHLTSILGAGCCDHGHGHCQVLEMLAHMERCPGCTHGSH